MRPSSNEAHLFQDRRLLPWVVVGAWTLLAIFSMRQMYAIYLERGDDPQLGPIASYNLAIYGCWAVLTPLVLWTVRRWPPLPFRWRHWLYLILAGLAIAALHAVVAPLWVAFAYSQWFQPEASFTGSYLGLARRGLGGVLGNQAYVWSMIGIYALVNHLHQFRKNKVRLDHLASQLQAARLQALQMQLHPHFLFNTLNTVSAMMRQDVEKADTMLAKLSDFLRLTLRSETSDLVALSEEFHFLRSYLDIQKIRFHDRLEVTFDLPQELTASQVPFLILQPLVENSVQHGLAPLANEARLRISAAEEDGMLNLSVWDNGAGMPLDGLVEGIGLTNTRRRLTALYGAQANLDWAWPKRGGFEIKVTLPLEK